MSKTITVSDEVYSKIKDTLGDEFKAKTLNELSDLVGEKFFFRAVTYHMIGEVVNVSGRIIQLKGACWVADSGNFTEAIAKGELDEVEITGDHYVNFESVVDFFPWKHDLPMVRK